MIGPDDASTLCAQLLIGMPWLASRRDVRQWLPVTCWDLSWNTPTPFPTVAMSTPEGLAAGAGAAAGAPQTCVVTEVPAGCWRKLVTPMERTSMPCDCRCACMCGCVSMRYKLMKWRPVCHKCHNA